MTLHLYEVTEELQAVHEELLENGGELTDEIERRLEQLSEDAAERVEWLCQFVRSAEAEAAARREEAQRQGKAARALERAAWSYKELIKAYLKAAGHKFIRAGVFRATRFRLKDEILIAEQAKLPEQVWEPQPDKVSKKRLREYYEACGEVPGCKIETRREGLRIT